MKSKTVLFLSPHTDDVELGCGATIAKLVEGGAGVHVIAFSTGHSITGASEGEFEDSMLALGVKNKTLMHYTTRGFDRQRQFILEKMIERGHLCCTPDIVFCPSGYSLHQDHVVVYNEAKRAFRHTSLVYYESPFVSAGFRPTLYIPVEQRHIDAKLFALEQYESQRHKMYFDPEFIDGLARVRGLGLPGGLAEAFEVERWIGF